MTDSTLIGRAPEERAQIAIRRVAGISVMAILLGLAMQGLILGGKLAVGGSFPGLGFLVDLAQGVTWSFLVCAGVSVGTAVARGRAALAGLIAALFAPVALAMAKAAQKVMTGVTKAATTEPVLSLATIGTFRAIEYGILGWVLAILVQRGETRALPYIGTGVAVGVFIGGAFAYLTHRTASANGIDIGAPGMVALIFNEVVFPIGCAVVIFFGQMIGRNMKVLFETSK